MLKTPMNIKKVKRFCNIQFNKNYNNYFILLALLLFNCTSISRITCSSTISSGVNTGKNIKSSPSSSSSSLSTSSDSNDNNTSLLSTESTTTTEEIDENNDDDHDERYSRQLYTLGNRAQKLIRSCNVIMDIGSSNSNTKSGLAYECGKNLVLSGIGTITLLYDDTTDEKDKYGDYFLDDLGKMYHNYATTLLNDDQDTIKDIEILKNYLQRLNPTCTIQIQPKSKLNLEGNTNTNQNIIYFCIDQTKSTESKMNKKCHARNIPFISTETTSFYGRIYNDFGNNFIVYDIDGEVPKLHSLYDIQLIENDDEQDVMLKIESNQDDYLNEISLDDVIELTYSTNNNDECSYTLKVDKIVSPTSFIAKLITTTSSEDKQEDKSSIIDKIINKNEISSLNNNDISFIKKKIPFTLSFSPSNSDKDVLSKINSPYDNKTREYILVTCFHTLHKFISKYKHTIQSNDDIALFTSMVYDKVQSYLDNAQKTKKKQKKDWIKNYIKHFATYSKYKLTPIQTIFGAIASQEVIKAATGLYIPIHQYFVYDVIDDFIAILPSSHKESSSESSHECLLGPEIIKKLNNQNIFVVGCGAIGCEILKNLSSLLSHAHGRGRIIITDMDTIEKSNLSRQLLFNDKNVGLFKSSIAKETLLKYNSVLNIESHTNKIGINEEYKLPFSDDAFWGAKKVDTVLNALDNMETRLYIDSKCVQYTIPLIDSGTLGSKGNVQVVVPYLSESYGSSTDPDDSGSDIPICTLKHFPYDISHTIQYAKDLFAGLYTKRPLQFIDYIQESNTQKSVKQIVSGLVNKYGIDETKDIVNELVQDMLFYSSIKQSTTSKQEIIKEHCIKWSIKLFYNLFYKSIYDLLIQHPPNSIDPDSDTNELFWSTNGRKLPKFISFDIDNVNNLNQDSINEYIIQFIQTSCKLRMELFIDDSIDDIEEWKTMLNEMLSYDNISKDILSYQTTFLNTLNNGNSSDDNDNKDEAEEKDNDDDTINDIINTLNQINIDSITSIIDNDNKIVTPIEFEKDNDKNNHVSFITSTSNLRAIIYNIKPISFQETRRIAGQIVPAMITTTALVSGLSCMEFIKFCSGSKKLNTFKNSFCNLALNFYAFTIPLPCEERYGVFDEDVYTLWDKIIIKERKKKDEKSGITLRQFMKRIQKKVLIKKHNDEEEDNEEDSCWEISTISYGPYMIYANFLQGDDDDALDDSIWDIVSDAMSNSSNDDLDVNDDFTDEKENNNLSSNNKDKVIDHEHQMDIHNKSILDFTIVVENAMTEEEIELPIVRLMKYKDEKDK